MRKAVHVFTIAIFATLMFASLASAAITISGNTNNLAQESGEVALTIASTQNETITLSIEDIQDRNMNLVDFEFADGTVFDLSSANNYSKSITLTYTVQSQFEFEFGKEYSTTLNVNGSESSAIQRTVSMEETDFCGDVDEDAGLEIYLDIILKIAIIIGVDTYEQISDNTCQCC